MPSPSKRRDLELTARVQIAAADAAQPQAQRTFSIDLYTGEPMRIGWWDAPVVIDLDTVDLTAQTIPALYDHGNYNPNDIVGQVNRLVIEDGKLKAFGFFVVTDEAADRNYAQQVLSRADKGYQWQASVGGDPASMEKVEPGNSIQVNGRTHHGPVYVARGLAPREASFVILGGDRRTAAVISRQRRNTIKGTAMTFEQWALGFMTIEEFSALDETAKSALQKAYDASGQSAPADDVTAEADPPVDPEEEKIPPTNARGRKPRVQAALPANHIANMRREAAEELQRQADVRQLCASYGSPSVEITENGRKRKVDLQAHAIAEGWTRDRTELVALRQVERVQINTPNLIVGASHPDATLPNILEAALCKARGHKDLEKRFKAPVLEAANTKDFRRMGLAQIILTAAAANGYRLSPGERIHDGNIREVLRLGVQAASTVSLPGILGNVANKELLLGYEEEDQTWREVAGIKTVNNFHAVTSYRMLDNMEYELVGPDGKIKHGSVNQESYTRQANTYAKMFALTRRDLINDDLGAFDDLRNRIGRGAAKKFNNVFWTEFLSDASTFWTTARGNYITGATTTLLADGVGLSLGIKAFRQMKSPSTSLTADDGGKRLGGNPELLLLPPELEQAGDQLYANQNFQTTSATLADNIYKGKYRPVVCPWLSDSAFTGYSTTAWYLLRSPSMWPVVVASFLNGQQSPTVEEGEADFDTLGIQFRGYHDFGCDQAEYLAGVKSKGAA